MLGEGGKRTLQDLKEHRARIREAIAAYSPGPIGEGLVVEKKHTSQSIMCGD